MLHFKYHGSRPREFKQEEFFNYSFTLLVNVKHVIPGMGPFLATESPLKQM